MDNTFIKNNYFEIFICIAITTAGLCRIFNPELRSEEISNLKIINDYHEYIIIIFELSVVYFLFYSDKSIKDIYINIYIIACILIAFYYLSDKNIIEEFKKLCIYTNDIKSIWCHLVYVLILIYIVYIK